MESPLKEKNNLFFRSKFFSLELILVEEGKKNACGRVVPCESMSFDHNNLATNFCFGPRISILALYKFRRYLIEIAA